MHFKHIYSTTNFQELSNFFTPKLTQEMGFPKSALRPSDTATVAAEDAVTSKSGGSRVYLVPGVMAEGPDGDLW